MEGLDAFWQELLLSKGKNVVATALSSSDGAADQVPKESRVGVTRRMKWLAAPYLHSAWGDRNIFHKHHAEPGRRWVAAAVSCHVDYNAPANVIERYRCARILIGCAAGSG